MANLPYRYPPAGPWWVSPSGSDSTGDGSLGNPWATIGKARTYLRTNNLPITQVADLQVNVRAGTYTEQLTFGSLDGGHNGHRVIYNSVDGNGAAIISGGQQITNWSLVSGSTYKASVPNAFWTMYENNVRSISARTPKKALTVGFPCSQNPYYLATSNVNETLGQMGYSTSDVTPGSWNLLSDVQAVVWPGNPSDSLQLNWLTDTQQMSAVNTTTHQFTFGQQTKFNATRNRYFLQGDKSFQSDPGEWYLDRVANQVYYIARDGAIGSQNIVIPTKTELVQFFGTSAADLCQNITFNGFAVAHTDFVGGFYRGSYAYDFPTATLESPFPQPHIIDPAYDYFATMPQFRLGAIHLRFAKGINITNCHAYAIGTNGVYAEKWVQNCLISGSLIEKCGISGIKFDGNYPGEGDYVNNNEVYNFKIQNVGELAGGASGIDVANSSANTIHYGYMANGPRKAIWMFADYPLDRSLTYTKNNLVDHVYMTGWCQDSNDTGTLTYTALNTLFQGVFVNTNSQIIIDNTACISSATGFAPNGCFTDNDSSGQVFTNVQVLNMAGGQYRDNSGGQGPILTNTSFLLNGLPDSNFNPALMDTANIGVTATFPY